MLPEDENNTPIWHSVSCICPECLEADELWLKHQSVMLKYTKRPFFAK